MSSDIPRSAGMARRKAARREIKRNVPPVVLYRRETQARLADDLHVHVQRFSRVSPLFPLEWRPLAEIG